MPSQICFADVLAPENCSCFASKFCLFCSYRSCSFDSSSGSKIYASHKQTFSSKIWTHNGDFCCCMPSIYTSIVSELILTEMPLPSRILALTILLFSVMMYIVASFIVVDVFPAFVSRENAIYSLMYSVSSHFFRSCSVSRRSSPLMGKSALVRLS